MDLIETVVKTIEPALTDMGYELVRVTIQGKELQTLQIMAERADRKEMGLDDCTKISRTASALLDVADPFPGKWVLEVSSPGIDRPLIKLADYERFHGEHAKIELNTEINGRRRFKGVLKGIKNQSVLLDFEAAELELPFNQIQHAKLTLPEEIFNLTKGKK
ncbi:MAG: ribosome maturation factor RimP [Alphaproteobacteria bacterium]|nr:ribosome maturation factor RimP [Alphaproteobacteria bacterium]